MKSDIFKINIILTDSMQASSRHSFNVELVTENVNNSLKIKKY
jgi:hypothetical protein